MSSEELRSKLELMQSFNEYAYHWELDSCRVTIPAARAEFLQQPPNGIKFIDALIDDLNYRKGILRLSYLFLEEK